MRKTALLLAALVLPATAGAQDWRGPAAIEVQVEDARGRNLAGAEVLLVYLSPDGGGSLPSVLTDAAGKANVGGLAAGRWSAEIRHAGHMSYRAELSISADGKPATLSASHLMAPGATSTMKVKFSRGRSAVAAPAAPAPAAIPPAPAVAKERAPAPPAPVPSLVPAPAPATASAPAQDRPPVAAPAPVAAPVAAPKEPPAKVSPPVAVAPPAPAAASAPAPAPPVVEPPPATPAPLAGAAAPAAPAPAPTPAPVMPPAPVAAAPVAPPPAAPAPPAPASPPTAPARARLCVECPPGESAAWAEAAIAGAAPAGCPADLQAKLKAVELSAVGALSSELAAAGLGCRVLAVELPAGARFTGFRYEAQSATVVADCLPGRSCPAGDCRFPHEPVLRIEGNRTTLLVSFESTAAEPRRAVVAGYSTYSKR